MYRFSSITFTPIGPGDHGTKISIVPLNTDFDLYSMGQDGASKGPLSAKASRDDVLRAGDGTFVGPAADF